MKKVLLINLLGMFLLTYSFAQSTSSLRSDGVLLANGQPIFPFGSYSLPWDSSLNRRMSALQTMIGAGFNVVLMEDGGVAGFSSLLDTALANNVKVFLSVPYDPNIVGEASFYKNHSSILGWMVADDADDGAETISSLISRNAAVKAADPNHLTILSLTGYYAARRALADSYTPISDVSAYQIYPINPPSDYDVTSSNALTETYKRTLLYVQSAASQNKPLLMHTQTFSWGSQSPNPRYATVSELRNMMYSGLAAGIKGILTYDFSFDLVNNQPSLWNEFKSLRTDVSALQSALLDGVFTRVNTGDQELVSSYWIYNNKCYVAVVNTSYTTAKNVSIALPSGFTANKTSLFSRMPNTLSLSGATLTGSIPAQAVELYSIDYAQTSGANLFTNPGFENLTNSWTGQSCTLSSVPTPIRSGTAAGRASSRTQTYSGPYQDIKMALEYNGTGTYYFESWVRTANANANANVTIFLKYGGNEYYFASSPVAVNKNSWTKVSNYVPLNWTGTLTQAGAYIETATGTQTLYFDDLLLQKAVAARAAPIKIETDVTLKSNLIISPIPVSDKLVIRNIEKNSSIVITSIEGKVVYISQKIENRQLTLFVKEWSKGMYVIKVYSPNNKSTVQKIVVQ